MRKASAFATMFAAFVAVQWFASPRSDAQPRRPAPRTVAPLPGVCDTANVADVFPDLTEPRTKREQIAFFTGTDRAVFA